VTNNLERRVWEHWEGHGSQFAARYGVKRLDWATDCTDIRDAIERVKWSKGWRRAKKIAMIEEDSSELRDRAGMVRIATSYRFTEPSGNERRAILRCGSG
jgi:putative endonuclease